MPIPYLLLAGTAGVAVGIGVVAYSFMKEESQEHQYSNKLRWPSEEYCTHCTCVIYPVSKVMLLCGHAFHRHCLSYLKNNEPGKCPDCKEDIPGAKVINTTRNRHTASNEYINDANRRIDTRNSRSPWTNIKKCVACKATGNVGLSLDCGHQLHTKCFEANYIVQKVDNMGKKMDFRCPVTKCRRVIDRQTVNDILAAQ